MREEALKAAANALEASLRQQYVDLIDAVEWHPLHFRRLILQIVEESDRAAAILFFSHIEDVLNQNLREAMRPEVSDLLQYPSGLSDFSSKLKLIYGLRWIEHRVYANLRILLKIRNIFAHRIDVHGFDHSVVSGLVTSIESKVKDALLEDRNPNMRSQFIVGAIVTFEELWRALMAGPVIGQLSYAPGYIRGMDNQPPENFRKSIYAGIAVASEFLKKVEPEYKHDDPDFTELFELSEDEWIKEIGRRSLELKF